MRIYLKNNPAKLFSSRSDLKRPRLRLFFEKLRPNKNKNDDKKNNKMSSDMGSVPSKTALQILTDFQDSVAGKFTAVVQ